MLQQELIIYWKQCYTLNVITITNSITTAADNNNNHHKQIW